MRAHEPSLPRPVTSHPPRAGGTSPDPSDMDGSGTLDLTRFRGHLILAEGRRKEWHHGSAIEVLGAVPSGSGADARGPRPRSRVGSHRRTLGIGGTTAGGQRDHLRNWIQAHLAEEARAADPLAVSPSEFEVFRRLRLEVKELKMENEILREAQETIRSAASGSSPSTGTPMAPSGSAECYGSCAAALRLAGRAGLAKV